MEQIINNLLSDFETGKMYPGNWTVSWSANEKDGTTYRDVIAVEPAA